MDTLKGKTSLTPIQYLTIGYIAVTLLFTLMLMLPIASKNAGGQSFVDALFMASSGISTTGLTVVDPGSYYSLFGQIMLLLDFQIGGIGYMAFFIFIAYILKNKLSRHKQLVASESIAGTQVGLNHNFFTKVILFTLIIELIGGIALFFYWLPRYSFFYALYLGIFHSISAFCTAGFCLFPNSLMSCQSSIFVNTAINIISLLGGIGFYVLDELYLKIKTFFSKKAIKRLSIHSKLALITTLMILLLGTAVIFISEKWAPGLSLKDKLLFSSFQTISASTTDGYNSIDIGAMSATSLFIFILLMFIGASPGSTGGGIKTTTLGVLFLTAKRKLIGEKDTNFFWRKISEDAIERAFTIFLLFMLVAIIDVLLLTLTENFSFLQILFEIISALGNTGLSTGITSNLSAPAKIILSITMFIGRVGPLTIGLALIKNSGSKNFSYAEEDVFVG